MEDNKVIVNVEVAHIDEYIEKANELINLLKKAKSLADELALVDFYIDFRD